MNQLVVCGVNLNSDNRGVQALGYGAVEFLKKVYGNKEISISLISTSGGKDLLIGDNVSQFSLSKKEAFLLFINKFHGVRNKRVKHLAETLSRANVVYHVTEGDSFSDIYGIKRFVFYLFFQCTTRLYAVDQIFLPQTIGPFGSRITSFLARVHLKKLKKLFVRDESSMDLALSYCIKATLIPDMAIFMKEEKPSFRLPYEDRNYIAINVSGLLYFDAYKKKLVSSRHYMETLKALIDHLVIKGQNIVLVPHTYSIASPIKEDDLMAAREIKLLYSDQNNIMVMQEDLSAPQLKYIFARSKLTVASRMHACIASLSGNAPAIALSYSYKFAGTFRNFKMYDWVFYLNDKNLDIKDIINKVDEALRDTEKLTGNIHQVHKELMGSAAKNFCGEMNLNGQE